MKREDVLKKAYKYKAQATCEIDDRMFIGNRTIPEYVIKDKLCHSFADFLNKFASFKMSREDNGYYMRGGYTKYKAEAFVMSEEQLFDFAMEIVAKTAADFKANALEDEKKQVRTQVLKMVQDALLPKEYDF